ncbi:MAG: putative DNA binding domain-containing protein [Planctomycetes bacterium]|nr:putative DNA binding domain-containing protein [Planctomycetota bacterium]MCC7398046.1 putative DNA binding domain-containing protein [Planctomycetota bacterium]
MPTETEWCEWKRNHTAPEELGEYLSALANEAALHRELCGYLLFGIDDANHAVVGTTFDPYKQKAKGNQGLLPWLSAGLVPNPGIDIFVVDHPDGRVVILSVGQARTQPVAFYGTAWVRVGTSKTQLTKHPEKTRALWTLGHDWSAEVVPGATLADLDPEALAAARKQFAVKHPAQAADIATWDDLTFLNKARVLRQGAITRAAILLLGRPESSTLLAPAVARVSWILKDKDNKELDYAHIDPPLLLAGDRLLQRVRNLTLRVMPSGTLFPQEITQYDPWVVREALHNSLAHQDYLRQGRVTVVEFPDRLLVTNVGEFLPGSVERVIEQDAPQAIYRNPFLAQAMVELGLIDTQGGGIKKMFETQRRRSFPLPDYDFSRAGEVRVEIPGRIVDERYTQLLMQRPQLSLAMVMQLDRVQKGRSISHAEHKALKAAGLVEGRYPASIVSAAVARATGELAEHIRQRGFDKLYYLDMIVALLSQHGPVDRQQVDRLLLAKLPERMTEPQKRKKIENLIQELRRAKRISCRRADGKSFWSVVSGGSPKES